MVSLYKACSALVPWACAATMSWCLASTAAIPLYPWMTPLSVAILALSLSVRLDWIGLDGLVRGAEAVVGVTGEPLARFGCLTLQALDFPRFTRVEVVVDSFVIGRPVVLDEPPGRGFELVGLTFEVGAGPAFALGGVTGQLDTVDGKHVATDEPLALTDGEYGAEHRGDIVTEMADEMRDGGEMRLRIATERDKHDVLGTGAGDGTAADDALGVGVGVGVEDYLEQGCGWPVGRTGVVVAVTGIEMGQVEFMVKEMIEGLFECAGQQLPRSIDRQQPGTRGGYVCNTPSTDEIREFGSISRRSPCSTEVPCRAPGPGPFVRPR